MNKFKLLTDFLRKENDLFMFSILKKDFRMFYKTPIGYIFTAAFLFFAYLIFTANNFIGQSSNMRNVFSNMQYIFIVVMPLLTMRLISEEKKLKTDQLLLTGPVSSFDVVLAKFLAAFSVFAIALALTLFMPLIIAANAQISFVFVLGNYVAILFAGATFIAIGICISSITESQVISAIASIAILFALSMVSVFINFLNSPVLVNIFSFLSIFDRYFYFTKGVFSFADVVYYISLVVLFLYLASRALDKRKTDRKISAMVTAAFIVFVFVFNIFVGFATDKFNLRADITGKKTYEISDATQQVLDGLDAPVTMYVLSNEIEFKRSVQHAELSELVSRYTQMAGGKLDLQYVDPRVSPDFIKTYEASGAVLADGSVIFAATNSDRFKVVTSDDISVISQGTYQLSNVAEQQLTSAILSVSTVQLPPVAILSGHAEPAEAVDNLTAFLNVNNIAANRLDLRNQDIPADTAMVAIVGPQSDFNGEEIARLDAYFKAGGNIMVFYSADVTGLANLNALMGEFGVEIQDTLVVDDQAYVSSRINVLAGISGSSFYGQDGPTIGAPVLMPGTKSFDRSGFANQYHEVEPLLVSTNFAYAKPVSGVIEGNIQRSDSDVPGPLPVAVVSTRTINQNNTTVKPMAVFVGSTDFLKTQAFNNSNVFNKIWLSTCVSKLVKADNMVDVPVKPYINNQMLLSGGTITFFVVLFLAVIPVAIVVWGIVVFVKRRHS